MTLDDGTTVIELPDDLLWEDEGKWTPVEQAVTYGLTGAMFVEEGTRQAGRPITLAGKDNVAWISREVLDSLLEMASIAGQEMTLTFTDAVPPKAYSVTWRHHDGGALDIESLTGFCQFDDESDFIVRAIRLMEV